MKSETSWRSLLYRNIYFCLCLYSLLVGLYAINDEPFFVEPIPNVTVASGRDITLPCVVENLGNYRVAWIHTDRHMLISLHNQVITRNPRYTVSQNGYRTWWLHISDVEEEDRGQYMCQINTSPMKSQSGYLDIVVPPKIDENSTSSDTEVREGSDVSIRCAAKGSPPPKIKWRREDGQDITIGKKKVSVIHEDYLNISKVSRLHMGPYLCIASNGVPPSVSKRILLNVNFSPMIWIPNQLVGAPVGTDVILDCNLESHPKSVTYWSREGGIMVLSNYKYDIMLINNGLYKAQMRLRIRDLRPDDFGPYTCVAKNSLGETEGTIRLYEIPRPTSTTMTSKGTHANSKGEEIQQTTSDKAFVVTLQNSLAHERKDVKKTDLHKELLDGGGSLSYIPASSRNEQNLSGGNRSSAVSISSIGRVIRGLFAGQFVFVLLMYIRQLQI